VQCGLRLGRRISCIWGNIDIQRDWGWAEDYVVAMYLMLQQEQFSFRSRSVCLSREATPMDDYVIATGESYKLAELDWREYVGQ
jgi:GDPmannose 4,6-dehydratase